MSISQAQAKAIADGFLATLGQQRTPNEDLPVIEALLFKYGAEFEQQAIDNLNANKSIASGNIQNNLTFEVTKFGTTYTLSMGYPKNTPASKYFDFVNQGVKGTKNIKADNKTPYAFKSNKKAIPVSVVEGFLKYNKKKTVAVKKYSKLGVELKAIEGTKSLKYAIARSIHRDGLRSTRYFDNARDSVFGSDFQKIINAALGFDVEIKITQIANEIKDGNNNRK
jgi:hypothetical protein